MCSTRVGSALLANIRLNWKGLAGTNTLAYYLKNRKFFNIGSRVKMLARDKHSSLFSVSDREEKVLRD
jgi:hypothetical protein